MQVERARAELAEMRRATSTPDTARGSGGADNDDVVVDDDDDDTDEAAALTDSLRRQLAALKRQRREDESLRCVWRQAAWQVCPLPPPPHLPLTFSPSLPSPPSPS